MRARKRQELAQIPDTEENVSYIAMGIFECKRHSPPMEVDFVFSLTLW